jgi:hypothetical protein
MSENLLIQTAEHPIKSVFSVDPAALERYRLAKNALNSTNSNKNTPLTLDAVREAIAAVAQKHMKNDEVTPENLNNPEMNVPLADESTPQFEVPLQMMLPPVHLEVREESMDQAIDLLQRPEGQKDAVAYLLQDDSGQKHIQSSPQIVHANGVMEGIDTYFENLPKHEVVSNEREKNTVNLENFFSESRSTQHLDSEENTPPQISVTENLESVSQKKVLLEQLRAQHARPKAGEKPILPQQEDNTKQETIFRAKKPIGIPTSWVIENPYQERKPLKIFETVQSLGRKVKENVQNQTQQAKQVFEKFLVLSEIKRYENQLYKIKQKWFTVADKKHKLTEKKRFTLEKIRNIRKIGELKNSNNTKQDIKHHFTILIDIGRKIRNIDNTVVSIQNDALKLAKEVHAQIQTHLQKNNSNNTDIHTLKDMHEKILRLVDDMGI